MNPGVTAVVVTYNRKDLLIECLEAIQSQSYPVSSILLIDNASTDGTHDALNDKGFLRNNNFIYCLMETNLGGAGGFHEGFRRAAKLKNDFIWIMDDDTVPEKNALEELISAERYLNIKNEKASFLASTVFGENGEAMNVPQIDGRVAPNGYSDWYRYLDEGIVKIKNATFVSLLIPVDSIKKCGLPYKDFFIWGDDAEYTQRLTEKAGRAYLVGKSRVCHKRKNAKALLLYEEKDTGRMDMYHLFYRNNLLSSRFYNKREYHKILCSYIREIFVHIIKYRNFKKAKIVIKGICESCFQYPAFVRYVKKQLKIDT